MAVEAKRGQRHFRTGQVPPPAGSVTVLMSRMFTVDRDGGTGGALISRLPTTVVAPGVVLTGYDRYRLGDRNPPHRGNDVASEIATPIN